MTQRRHILKRLFYLGAPLLILASAFSFLMPQKVYAANETYTWKSNTVLGVSGGDLDAADFTTNAPTNSTLFGTFHHKSGCYFRMSIMIGFNNTGRLDLPTSIGAPGSPSNVPNPTCASRGDNNPALAYDNQQVNISNARPGPGDAAETDLQKNVSFTINSSQPSNLSPATINIIVTNAAGQTVATTSGVKDTVDRNPNEAARSVYYRGSVKLEGAPAPGVPYKVCFVAPVPFAPDWADKNLSPCQNFNKVKYNGLNLTYGTSYVDPNQFANVAVRVNGTISIGAGNGYKMGPVDITIEKADGTGKQTVLSDTYIYNDCQNREPNKAPTDAECAAQGSGVQIPINPSVFSNFEPIAPGEYKVCVPALNKCQSVTKVVGKSSIVNFDITSAETNTLANTIAGDEETPRCETNGNPLTWILCPIFDGLTGIADWILEDILQPLLRSEPISLDPNSSIYKIWSAFRVYGNIVLLIALIVAVFGQVIGGGLVEAYTARKMLPRILLAAVLINLSIYIVALAVDISNIIGFAVADLIISPVQSASQFTFSSTGITVVGVTVGAGVFAAWFAGLFGVLAGAAPFILLFVVLPAVLALLGVFITIILLHALIFTLVIVSTVAFALYCLPNTERYFRTWWDWLFRALLVYPIIMILFAIADVMSVAILQAN
jgi:hypothetical protein